jgi:1-deoxy-D-xylulose-5-phosphate reductoisomerase
MRVPISYGLHYPERVEVPVRALDLAELGALTFEPVDIETFPCLRLAREAGLAGGTAPCTLNAANEVAVHAFLGNRITFLQVAEVIEETMAQLPKQRVHSFDSLARADAEARGVASGLVQSLTSASGGPLS